MTLVENLVTDESASVGYVGRLLIGVWCKEPPDMAQRFENAVEHGITKYKRDIGHLLVLEPGMPLVSAEARRRIVAAGERYDHVFSIFVMYVPTGGFLGAAFRAMLTGMRMMSPRIKVPVKIVGTLEEAARELAAHLPNNAPPLTVATVTKAVEEMRGKIKSAARK